MLKKCSGVQTGPSDIKKTVYKKKIGPKKNKTLLNDKQKVGPDLFKVGLGPTSWPYIKKNWPGPLAHGDIIKVFTDIKKA